MIEPGSVPAYRPLGNKCPPSYPGEPLVETLTSNNRFCVRAKMLARSISLRRFQTYRPQDHRTKVGNYLTQLRQGTPGDACAMAPFDETQHFAPREASRPAYEEVYQPSGL